MKDNQGRDGKKVSDVWERKIKKLKKIKLNGGGNDFEYLEWKKKVETMAPKFLPGICT